MKERVAIEVCAVCGHNQKNAFMEVQDHMISKETFQLAECSNCGFVFTSPRPHLSVLADYYKSEDYISHSSSKKGLINSLYLMVRSFTLRKKVNLIQQFTNKGKVLDIGSGTGHFVAALQQANIDVVGVEPDQDARSFAWREHKVELQSKEALKGFDSNSFDAITLWHVLEHIPSLDEDISEVYRLLKEDGKLFIAVPNRNSYDAKNYLSYWAAYDVPRHLHHFREKDIKQLFQRNSFQLINTLPMRFDAYYVSMLSEKYKNGNFLKGILVGWLSNMKAKKSGGFSSQIYVLGKKKDLKAE